MWIKLSLVAEGRDGCLSNQGGLLNGAHTDQCDDLKSFNLGRTTLDPNYTPRVDFLDHDLV